MNCGPESKVGDKVMFTHALLERQNMYRHDLGTNHLTDDETYSISDVEVYDWYTTIKLVGFEQRFNSAEFTCVYETVG